MSDTKPVVGIIMGSDSDLPVMTESAKILDKFGIPFEIEVTSAHRSPARTHEYATTAIARGLKRLLWRRAARRIWQEWWQHSRHCRSLGCRWDHRR